MSEEITIPLPAGAAPPFDPAVHLKERAAAEGRELPLSKPLSRRGERVVIALVTAVVLVGTVLGFSMNGPSQTGVGWLMGGIGGAMLAALVWAHLSGGFDKTWGAPRAPAAQPATALVAPARDPSVLPTTYRLAPARARLAAWLLDQALALLPLALTVLSREQRLVPQAVITSLLVLGLAVFLLGPPLSLWLTNGRTPGRKLLGLRVVRTDGMRITLGRALRRELGGALRGQLLLSLASMRMEELRRSPADTRARTVVVTDDAQARR